MEERWPFTDEDPSRLIEPLDRLDKTGLFMGNFAEAWYASQFKLKCRHIPLKRLAERRRVHRCSKFKLIAAVQIYIEHGAIIAQIDLKVELQAGMRHHHGCDQGKVLFYTLAKRGLIWRVCDEACGASGEAIEFEVRASQHDACGPRTRADRLHGMRARGIIPWRLGRGFSLAPRYRSVPRCRPVRPIKPTDATLQVEVQGGRLRGR